ncbi:MAG: hypothetical protein ACP5GJ_02395 [Nanopusillaceae archaeon]|jgi:hypothetical protein
MNKRDIITSLVIFVVVFLIVSMYLLISKGYFTNNANYPLRIKFYPNPYNYTVNISNNSLYIYLNDIQLPYINTSNLILNISGNLYKLNCSDNTIYQNQSTVCFIKNISIENNTYIQLLYPFNNVLYNIMYKT